MNENIYYTNGNNNYKDYEFDSEEWSAPRMVEADDIMNRLDEMKLVGRTIKELKFVSHAYNLTEGLPKDEQNKKSEYENIDEETMFLRFARIDEPFLIHFNDNDQFEIVTEQAPIYRMSLNCIPWYIEPGICAYNADANVIFNTCIGRNIVDVEVERTKTDSVPLLSKTLKDIDREEKEIVSSIVLWLDDNTGICIEYYLDYCDVTLIDKDREIMKIPFGQLEKGLYNWEEIHGDVELGLYGGCKSLWFGEKGKSLINNPYITITPESRKHCMYIHEDDMMLVSIAISIVIGRQHDEYEDYDFSYDQWNNVLKEIDTIATFKKFDDFFDYVLQMREKSNGNCDLIYYVNNCGLNYWRNKELHTDEAKDVRKWTELARKPGEKIYVIGY